MSARAGWQTGSRIGASRSEFGSTHGQMSRHSARRTGNSKPRWVVEPKAVHQRRPSLRVAKAGCLCLGCFPWTALGRKP